MGGSGGDGGMRQVKWVGQEGWGGCGVRQCVWWYAAMILRAVSQWLEGSGVRCQMCEG